MFIRVDNYLFNLEELQSAQFIEDRDTGSPILKMNFKRGRSVYVADKVTPATMVFDVIIEALDSVGQLYIEEPDPGPEIELSEETTECLRQLYHEDFAWIARDKDGKLYAYLHRPVKRGAYWEDSEGSGFRHALITNEAADEELDGEEVPLNIMELLLGT